MTTPMRLANGASSFEEILEKRRSIRAFLPTPVPLDLVQTLLHEASLAPSSTNTQPWKVNVVTGEVRDRLVSEVLAHRKSSPPDESAEFPQFRWDREPFVTRMRRLGKEMYTILGVPRGDMAARDAQWARNYQFFDAPVGMIFTLDKDLDRMSYIDLGLFMQTLMIAATLRGLGTCAHGAWHDYWSVTRRVLNIPENEFVVCGLSLGYTDPSAAVNFMDTEREPVEGFARFHGFASDDLR